MVAALFRRVVFGLWLAQAGLVLAAQQVMSPETIPLIQWGYTLVLALAGGAAASLTRYAGGAPTAKWRLELGRDFVCSGLAGVIVLLGSSHFGVPPLLAAIGIALAGWGGSKTLEWAFGVWQRRAAATVGDATEAKP